MKAMQIERGGGGMRLAEIPPPEPSPKEVRVRVQASSVNPIDWKLHGKGLRWFLPVRFPSTPGFDVAGEVEAVGRDVQGLEPGERVFGMSDHLTGGAAAEQVVLGADAVARSPLRMNAVEAAVLPLAGLTALQALRQGGIRPGTRVLVIGASGGVGHFAVQIAKAKGASVTGVCSGRHVELVRNLGADRVVDYETEPDYLAPGAYDLILDVVVRKPLRELLGALAPRGIYVSTLPSASRLAARGLLPLASKKRVRLFRVRPGRRDLEELARLCEAGALRPVIGERYALVDLALAHERSREGGAAGKIAVVVGGDGAG